MPESIDSLVQNIEKNKANYKELIESLITFGEEALKPLFDISIKNYDLAGWDTIEENIGEAAMKALAEIGGAKAIDYLGLMLEIKWSDDWGTPNWNARCNAAELLDNFTPNSKVGDVAASAYMSVVKNKEEVGPNWSYDQHHGISCSDLMELLLSLIETNGIEGYKPPLKPDQIHETLETEFSGYCYECFKWVRPEMDEEEELEYCPLCEAELES